MTFERLSGRVATVARVGTGELIILCGLAIAFLIGVYLIAWWWTDHN